MLDFSHIKNGLPGLDIQEFVQASPTDGTFTQVWNKPRGISMVSILLIGGGGGGGAGRSGAVNASGGGGGGGSAAYTLALVPAWVLPNIIYVAIGKGGSGGIDAVAAAAGIASRLAAYPNTDVGNSILITNGGGAGGRGGAPGAGTSGAAGTVSAATQSYLSGLMLFGQNGSTTNLNSVGIAGTAGGTTGAGVNLAIPRSLTIGGLGGAGLAAATGNNGSTGGTYTNPSANTFVYPAHVAGTAGLIATPVNGGNGSNGIPVSYNGSVVAFLGGTGGGSATSSGGTGGNGGSGAYGSGGGGGGASLTPNAPGVGGDGGNGYCLITSW